jgi:hypothetical protein
MVVGRQSCRIIDAGYLALGPGHKTRAHIIADCASDGSGGKQPCPTTGQADKPTSKY